MILILIAIPADAMICKDMFCIHIHCHSCWCNDMQGYVLHSHTLPFLPMQTFWIDTHWTDTYWMDTVGGICIERIRIGGIHIGGIRVVEWICVGYVWREIRQQSSEEPCDETSFGKKSRTFWNLVSSFCWNFNLVILLEFQSCYPVPIFRTPVKRIFVNTKVRGFATVSGSATAKSVSVDTRRRTTPKTANQLRSNTTAFVAMTAAGTEQRANPRSSNTKMSPKHELQGDNQKAI